MKIYKPFGATVLRATVRMVESDLGEEVVVFVGNSTVAKQCFMCHGNVFQELIGTTDLVCHYCRTVYETK